VNYHYQNQNQNKADLPGISYCWIYRVSPGWCDVLWDERFDRRLWNRSDHRHDHKHVEPGSRGLAAIMISACYFSVSNQETGTLFYRAGVT